MGVDIGTYRSRIGTFRHGTGVDVILVQICVNYAGCLKMVGAVTFIGLLLLMAGVESNPGPVDNNCDDKDRGDEVPGRKFIQSRTSQSSRSLLETEQICPGSYDCPEQGAAGFSSTYDETQKSTKLKSDPSYMSDEPNMQTHRQHLEHEQGSNTCERGKDETGIRKFMIRAWNSWNRPDWLRTKKRDSNTDCTAVIRDEDSVEKLRQTQQKQKKEVINKYHGENITPDKSVADHDQNKHKGSGQKASPQPVEPNSQMAGQALKDEHCYDRSNPILDRLELRQWFPGKITIQDVTAVDIDTHLKEDINFSNLAWLILKKLLMANSNAVDKTINDFVFSDMGDDDLKDDCDECTEGADKAKLWPLDVFITIFHCCDGLLKQRIYKQLLMCRLAVPLLYTDPISYKLTLSVWPLRQLIIDYRESNQTHTENSVLQQPSKVIVFARFGRPPYSKSKLQNSLLSDSQCDTFHNKDCPLGMSSRSISMGYVEASWYLPGGKENELYNEVITFVNARGDLATDFKENHVRFLQKLCNVFVLITDIHNLIDNYDNLMNVLEPIGFVILILTNSRGLEYNTMKENARLFKSKFRDNNIDVVFTNTEGHERNTTEMKNTVRRHLKVCMEKTSSKKLSDFATGDSNLNIVSDEENALCQKGKKLAEEIIICITECEAQENWQAAITPLQFKHWRVWSTMQRKFQRPKENLDELETMKTASKDHLQKLKFVMISNAMQCFANTLIANVDNRETTLYFMEWLNIFLNDKSRVMLPNLRRNYSNAWEKLKKLKGANDPNLDLREAEENVKLAEKTLADASFGIEHMLREIGQMHEAEATGQVRIRHINIPGLSKAAAKLVSYGFPIELLDGDASNIPMCWINSVLGELEKVLHGGKIMTLSVLGIQSSGKSTLLNTMFGLQFAVSAGRCTRGVYMQLVRTVNSFKGQCKYMIIFDSEGLRAPELREEMKNNDNELATFVIGLGDITLLNIKGENATEINDILEICVHAFIRLKVANKKLELRQTCMFVHQNVSDVSASDKLMNAVHTLVEQLDNITEEAAKNSNLNHIKLFNQVIQFDDKKHVCYLHDLWYGNPPMAAVNPEYIQNVRELRQKIVTMAFHDKGNSYKALTDISVHVNDLWKAIQTEDFVFSFKNSIEIRAYVLLETKYKKLTWELESFAIEETKKSKRRFVDCQRVEEVNAKAAKIIQMLKEALRKRSDTIIAALNEFFKDNQYVTILISWQEIKINKMRRLSAQLEQRMEKQIHDISNNCKVQIMTTSSRKIHEDRLQEESLKLANKLKNQHPPTVNIEAKFDQLWEHFVDGVESETDMHYTEMHSVFRNILYTIFSTGSSELTQELEKSKDLQLKLNLESLVGSFGHHLKQIVGKHEIIYLSPLSVIDKAKQVFGVYESHKRLENILNTVFRRLDNEIQSLLCLDSEIGDMQVTELLHIVTEWVDDTNAHQEDHGFILMKPLIAKLYVHVSWHAQYLLEEHNTNYRKKHNIKEQLSKYKGQVRLRFMSYLDDRKAEWTAAELFKSEIRGFIVTYTTEMLWLDIDKYLGQKLPYTKLYFILDILNYLSGKNSFPEFIDFIKYPKAYATKFLQIRSRNLLFEGTPQNQYYELAERTVSDTVENIENAVNKASSCNGISTISEWITEFKRHLSECQISIERERFRDVEREKITNFQHFTDNLIEALSEVKSSVAQEFNKHTMDTLKWPEPSIFKRVTDRAWGCEETCVFCCEPCWRDEDHLANSEHSCIQHRPSGIRGTRDKETQEISLTSCNFDVQSTWSHNCAAFDFTCNPNKTKCAKEWHPYKEFRSYLKSWFIKPTPDMDESSKFWMWFIAKYKSELQNYYVFKTDNIPISWSDITEQEAKDSLREIYGGVVDKRKETNGDLDETN